MEHLHARLEALVLAGIDMMDVFDTAEYLLTDHSHQMPWRARRTLETGLFVTYSRPFVQTRDRPPMNPAGGLSGELREVHEGVLIRRNRVYAHTDRTELRRIIEFSDPAERAIWIGQQGDLREEWFPPTDEVLRDLMELAREHMASFLEEIEAVRERIISSA